MIDKLLDFIIEVWEDLLPFVVIPVYDKGVRLRFGLHRDTLEPGFHFKIPFADNVLTQMVVTATMETEQTLTTKDGKEAIVKSVIKYDIEDVATLLLKVNDARDAVSDMTRGIIRKEIVKANWAECNSEEIEKSILTKARREAKKWGINIIDLTITDLSQSKTVRLLGMK